MYISAILKHWKMSLSLLKPQTFGSLIIESVKKFSYAFKQTVSIFWWLFIADLVLRTSFNSYANNLISRGSETVANYTTSLLVFSFFTEVSMIVIRASYLLFVRDRTDNLSASHYIAFFILRLMQIRLVFLFIWLLMGVILSHINLEPIMVPLLWVLMITKILGLLIIFYWLDSQGSLKDILISLERGANLFIYRLPFFALIIIGMIALSWGIQIIILQPWNISNAADLTAKVQQLLKTQPIWLMSIVQLMLHYALVTIQCIIVSFLYCFYKTYRDENYATSLFE